MKERVYRVLVSRVPGIRDRYQQKRKEAGRLASLVYLLWLNIQYYLFFRRGLEQPARYPVYEEKRLCVSSESARCQRKSPEELAQELASYEVISFDVFDTLLFRRISHPADLFYLVGETLRYPDFRQTRMAMEEQARKKKQNEKGTPEVTLEEIWHLMERETGIPQRVGIEAEWEWETKCCFANPYFLRVVGELQRRGKPVVIISDMYLGEERIRELLRKCGYGAFSGYFVSCDWGTSKWEGGLYDKVREAMGKGASYAHVGDHHYSDQRQAQRHGFQPFSCPNVNEEGKAYRAGDLSPVTGSVYRGLVNAHLYNGLTRYSREYEYGYVYGGLFAAGYCRFIHDYAEKNGIEKILFFSRDGYVLQKAYLTMYPEEKTRTAYAYWSRRAAVKISAGYYRREYFQRFLFHKADQRYTIRQVLEAMELEDMLPELCAAIKIDPQTHLTYKNAEKIKEYLIDTWKKVLEHYREQSAAAKAYYQDLLQGCKRVAAVDIGWAGRGAIMLREALRREWGIQCQVTGIVAGTVSSAGIEADGVEPFLLHGQLISYLYSQRENRDLWKFHDPERGHNLYWELLLGAPEGSLVGFYWDGQGKPALRFKKNDPAKAGVLEIHRGILDFVQQFLETERWFGFQIPISGRDAYAPMILVESRKNRDFLKDLEDLMDDVHIA